MKKCSPWVMIVVFMAMCLGIAMVACDDAIYKVICSTDTFTPTMGPDGTFGSEQSDVGTAVRRTRDGGCVVAGYTWAGMMNLDLGPTNYWIMRFDHAHSLVWSKVYGLAGREYPYDVYETQDGGFVVAGHKRLKSGNHLDYLGSYWDFWILRLDGDGNVLWEQTYGDRGYEKAHAILEVQDGGIVVAGFTTSYGPGTLEDGVPFRESKKNVWVARLDSSGQIVWEYVAGGVEEDGAYAVQETSDGHFIVAGFDSSTHGKGNYDFLVVKLDSDGNEVWKHTYGGIYPENAYAVQETEDGGFIIAGDTWSMGNGNTDFLVMKIDRDGGEIWRRSFGGEKFERAYALRRTADGNYVVAGYTSSYGAGDKDGMVVKFSPDGEEIWRTIFGWEAFDILFAVDVTPENRVIATGTTASRGAGQLDLWLVGFTEDGDVMPF